MLTKLKNRMGYQLYNGWQWTWHVGIFNDANKGQPWRMFWDAYCNFTMKDVVLHMLRQLKLVPQTSPSTFTQWIFSFLLPWLCITHTIKACHYANTKCFLSISPSACHTLTVYNLWGDCHLACILWGVCQQLSSSLRPLGESFANNRHLAHLHFPPLENSTHHFPITRAMSWQQHMHATWRYYVHGVKARKGTRLLLQHYTQTSL